MRKPEGNRICLQAGTAHAVCIKRSFDAKVRGLDLSCGISA